MSLIINYDEFVNGHRKARNDSPRTIQNFSRTIILGMTGSRKTNVLFNLLFNLKVKVTYTRVYLSCRNLNESKYVFMVFEKIKKKSVNDLDWYAKLFANNVIPVDELDSDY